MFVSGWCIGRNTWPAARSARRGPGHGPRAAFGDDHHVVAGSMPRAAASSGWISIQSSSGVRARRVADFEVRVWVCHSAALDPPGEQHEGIAVVGHARAARRGSSTMNRARPSA